MGPPWETPGSHYTKRAVRIHFDMVFFLFNPKSIKIETNPQKLDQECGSLSLSRCERLVGYNPNLHISSLLKGLCPRVCLVETSRLFIHKFKEVDLCRRRAVWGRRVSPRRVTCFRFDHVAWLLSAARGTSSNYCIDKASNVLPW